MDNICTNGNNSVIILSYLRIAYLFLEVVRISLNIIYDNFSKTLQKVKIRMIFKIVMLILLILLILGFYIFVLHDKASTICFEVHNDSFIEFKVMWFIGIGVLVILILYPFIFACYSKLIFGRRRKMLALLVKNKKEK